jgi:hypothetical protein
MEKRIIGMILCFLLMGSVSFAADGDLIVNGNLGVGTTTPGDKLEVSGGGVVLPYLNWLKFRASGGGASSVLGPTDAGTVGIRTIDNAGAAKVQIQAVNGTPIASFRNDGIVTVETTANVLGSLAIGTASSPGDKLEISGGGMILPYLNWMKLRASGGGAWSVLGTTDAGTVGVRTIDNGAYAKFQFQGYDGTPLVSFLNNGHVGIGTTDPGSYSLKIIGSVWSSYGSWEPSDGKYKKNVQPLTNALDKILQLRGVSFDWDGQYTQKGYPAGRDYGVIAQEVKAVLPQAVMENSIKEGADFHSAAETDPDMAVSYTKLVPFLIEAIKELQREIEILKAKVK